MNENLLKMNKKALERLSSKQREKLETYILAFIAKFPQVIVQSRCGEKRQKSSGKSYEKDVFELAIEENIDIQEKVQVACQGLNPLQDFCLCVETFLITADGDTLVLEAWNLRLAYSETYWDPKYRLYAELEIVIGNLMMLLKSIIAVTRCTPAYKLSLGQSATTHVILYRIYPGEPQVQQLGSNPNVNKIGEVYTPVGTISVTVACRSKSEMTITPQSSGKENSFMLKSDYFNLDLSPKRTFSGARTIKNRVLRNSTNSQNPGAFATCSVLPDPNFPHLEFLQKNILHPSRSCLNRVQEKPVDNPKGDVNSNVSSPPEPKTEGKLERDMVCERLSCSDVSDGSDFVFVDMKPPFANPDPDTDLLNAFYHECQCAPSLSSFSNSPSLQEQVQDVAGQLEKFEISMMDFDNFVDSVCQVNAEI